MDCDYYIKVRDSDGWCSLNETYCEAQMDNVECKELE